MTKPLQPASSANAAQADNLIGMFPTPLLHAKGVLPPDLVAALIRQFEETATGPNVRTALLAHTPVAAPRAHQNFTEVLRLVTPKMRQFGTALLGEDLAWGIKEIWINKMETGGSQKIHNHANSFISGILYLTPTDPSAATIFHKPSSPTGFQMANENKNCQMGPFNATVFQAPPVAPGDLILFPSYIMHEVPPNQGPTRLTAAFNALPERIDSWGYAIRFK